MLLQQSCHLKDERSFQFAAVNFKDNSLIIVCSVYITKANIFR